MGGRGGWLLRRSHSRWAGMLTELSGDPVVERLQDEAGGGAWEFLRRRWYSTGTGSSSTAAFSREAVRLLFPTQRKSPRSPRD